MALQDILDQKSDAKTAQLQGSAVATALAVMVNATNVMAAAGNQLAGIAAGGNFDTIGVDYKAQLIIVKDLIDAFNAQMQIPETDGMLA